MLRDELLIIVEVEDDERVRVEMLVILVLKGDVIEKIEY